MGKGGGSQPTSQTVTNTNLPEYAKPYFENIMNRAQALSYDQYVPYQNERTAYFTPGQLQTQQEVMGMQDPSQFYDASNIAYNAANRAMNVGNYQPGQFGAQMTNVQNVNAPYLSGFRDVNAPDLSYVQDVIAPELLGFRDVNAERVASRDINAAQSYYRPELRDILAAAPERVSTDRLAAAQLGGPREFTAETAQQYMSPYMQNVVDVQKREALRDAQIGQLGQNLAAARQGTFGGARQALLTGERERGLRTQLGDIQATGSQKAFEQAQQQFERDRAAQIQVGLANLTNEQQARVLSESNRLQSMGMNQDAALKTALANQQSQLSTQQLGTQTGLQTALANLTNQQQAQVQSEANRLQAQGMNQDAALKTALANQQSQLSTQQLQTQTGLQTALANLTNQQQARVQNAANKLQAQGMSAENALRAALANQQAGLTVGQQNLQAKLQAQQMGEQSRQFGANLGLQGLQQAMAGAQTLGGLGSAQQEAQLRRLGAQGQVGAEQRAYQQQLLDQAYGDFLRQRDYPLEQLGYFSNLMRGVPVGLSSTQTAYQAPPSAASQLAGAGIGALGLSRLMGG